MDKSGKDKLILVLLISFIAVSAIAAVNIIFSQFSGYSLIHNKMLNKATLPLNKFICVLRGGNFIYAPARGYYCQTHSINSGPGSLPGGIDFKPVIYLYPVKEEKVTVTVDYKPGFTVTYPKYKDGWRVKAHPDGKIINLDDDKEYSYLFWEGGPDTDAYYDMTKGFVVKGKDTAVFLQEKLSQIGLKPAEYNEFIVYWLPKMKDNPYNLIHFADSSEYDERVKLNISPEPESVLRVFIVFKPLRSMVDVEQQSFPAFERKGFTVVEWGGTQI